MTLPASTRIKNLRDGLVGIEAQMAKTNLNPSLYDKGFSARLVKRGIGDLDFNPRVFLESGVVVKEGWALCTP